MNESGGPEEANPDEEAVDLSEMIDGHTSGEFEVNPTFAGPPVLAQLLEYFTQQNKQEEEAAQARAENQRLYLETELLNARAKQEQNKARILMMHSIIFRRRASAQNHPNPNNQS